MIASQQPPFAAQRGFTAITERVYIRNVCDEPSSPPLAQQEEPTTVVIFGWGDAALKHVSKYSDGYHNIFPRARIIVVLSRTLQAVTQRLESRIEAMMPVIDIVFPTPCTLGGKASAGAAKGDDGNKNAPEDIERERIVLHAMSNTGSIFLAATLLAYQRRRGTDRKFPVSLLVCDSTPGSLDFTSQVGRWSRAMAVGILTSRYLRTWLPFITITQVQAVTYMVLWANWAWEKLRGTEPSGIWANRVINDLAIVPVESYRLYMYSKEDEIIWWEDLLQAAAQAKALGYRADLEVFKGSPHVGHMRLHPERYWKKVLSVWEGTLLGTKMGRREAAD
ncbi:hypothetical protein BJX68DRAFT_266305 [Aspergillus pseudodeflectus]|uniref:DUF829-domain-containing protein n=1 Tax=Aspergillus pseudodeflectus TaxID=176178 RepID=A0ABR4KGP9_9EURO